MPCRSDYLEPNEREKELRRAAELLIYVCEQTHRDVEPWMRQIAEDLFATSDRAVTVLCATLKAMDPSARDALVYNAHDRNARDLASWWEDHQAADAARELDEAKSRAKASIAAEARAKLTDAERAALGIK